jgi:hypothetical protein
MPEHIVPDGPERFIPFSSDPADRQASYEAAARILREVGGEAKDDFSGLPEWWPTRECMADVVHFGREYARILRDLLLVEDDPDCNANMPGFPKDQAEQFAVAFAAMLDELLAETYHEEYSNLSMGWPVDVITGLVWFRDLFYDLLDRWGWRPQEVGMARLSLDWLAPGTIASLRRDELAAFDRALAMIARGLEDARDDRPDRAQGAAPRRAPIDFQATTPSPGKTLEDWDAEACKLLIQHPDWTVKRIAQEMGYPRTSLYRLAKFQKARAILEQGKGSMPRGWKGDDGVLEAADDPDAA